MATALEQKLSQKGTTLLYITKSSVEVSATSTQISGEVFERETKPTVVFVHNMWGNHKIMHRHVELFSSLGHNCVTFNLFRASSIKEKIQPPFWFYFMFIYKAWILQITDVLDSIPGDKIIFTMSGPSISAIIACDQRKDVLKFICDGGPFKELWQCTYRLFTHTWHIRTGFLRSLFTAGAILLWGPRAFKHSQEILSRWPKHIPFFSIRGVQDPLVYPQNIDGIFKDQPHLDMKIWLVAEGHHLDGLKLLPEQYKKNIIEFLGNSSKKN